MKLKDWKTITLCLVLLFAILIGGGYAARKGYVNLRQKRLVKQAKEFLAKSEDKKALLTLQRALRINPRDTEATRLMAGLVESGRSPAALMWRSRVVELAPNSTEDRLALARVGVMFGDPVTATNALAGIKEQDRNNAGYHNLAGSVFTSMRDLATAETHFAQAVSLEPANPAPRLNLAVIRLQNPDPQAAASARASLQDLSKDPRVRPAALRELLGDALRNSQTNSALSISAALINETNAPFSDQLLRLDVLKIARSPEFKPALAKIESDAASETTRVSELASWQMTRLGPEVTLSWLAGLPPSITTNTPIGLITAEAHASLKQWKSLHSSLETQNWAELDFVRHAFLARAMRGQDLNSAAKTEWDMALKAANLRKESLFMLLRLAGQWEWQNEGEEILWTIVSRFPGEKWAVPALNRTLYAGGRTRSLMSLYSQLAKTNPQDLDVQNNLAVTAMLLDAQEIKSHDIARSIYSKAPTNASYASTYAFSLYLQNKPKEALQVFQKLQPKSLEDPSIAGYYGLVLKASGDVEKARVYLNWSSKASTLPEEKKLFDQARL